MDLWVMRVFANLSRCFYARERKNSTRAKFYDISLICAHAPTEEKDDVVKDAFYAKLKDVYDKRPAHDAKIVLGDFNSKVKQAHCWIVQPPLEHYLQRYEADRFRRSL